MPSFTNVLDQSIKALRNVLGTPGTESVSQIQRGASIGGDDSLSSGTSISPDIPRPLVTLLSPPLSDLRTCDALVVAIVPFTDVFGDLDFGAALQALTLACAVTLPGEGLINVEMEEFEGALSTLAG